MKFGKKIVVFVIILNILYTIGCFVVFWHVGSEPTVLTASWFAFTTGELWFLSGIKKKEKKEE